MSKQTEGDLNPAKTSPFVKPNYIYVLDLKLYTSGVFVCSSGTLLLNFYADRQSIAKARRYHQYVTSCICQKQY